MRLISQRIKICKQQLSKELLSHLLCIHRGAIVWFGLFFFKKKVTNSLWRSCGRCNCKRTDGLMGRDAAERENCLVARNSLSKNVMRQLLFIDEPNQW